MTIYVFLRYYKCKNGRTGRHPASRDYTNGLSEEIQGLLLQGYNSPGRKRSALIMISKKEIRD